MKIQRPNIFHRLSVFVQNQIITRLYYATSLPLNASVSKVGTTNLAPFKLFIKIFLISSIESILILIYLLIETIRTKMFIFIYITNYNLHN